MADVNDSERTAGKDRGVFSRCRVFLCPVLPCLVLLCVGAAMVSCRSAPVASSAGVVRTGAVATEAAADTADRFPRRTVLFRSAAGSPAFERIIEGICNPATPMVVPDTALKASDHYFRITPAKFAKDETAVLGGRPYVFLTVPQAAYGRSLYAIYSDIGYDAESILGQRGQPMVGLVVRYRDDVRLSDVRDGRLDAERFMSYVYVPTWKNAFALFSLLAGEEGDPPMHLSLSAGERELARFFQGERRDRVAALPYALLRAAGGPDWQYRSLLASKMGMNEHFRGVGITESTLYPADDRWGLPEFVGPNRKLEDLLEYAVIDLGRMEIHEVHD